jgi:predicted nucleic acid-binding protein
MADEKLMRYAVKAHYLDASALVKLVAEDADEEPGRAALRAYYYGHSSKYATSYCVTEAFSAFKLKFLRKKITEEQYIQYVRSFIQRIIGSNLQVDEVPILTPLVFKEAERMIQKHKIDFIDCFQIVTVLHGKYRVLVGVSQSILITADRGLAKAARAEGARVWECTTEPPPA